MMMMMFIYPRETPPHIRTVRASPQRHTAAGPAAPTPQTRETQSPNGVFTPKG